MFPLRDINPSESFPKVTLILILVNLGVFILEIMAGPELLNQLVYIFGLVPAYINDPSSLISYYPFLTSTFLHGGWMHLIGNMWILWLFGDNIEDHMGSGRFLLFYLICGLLAGMTHYYINPHSTIPVVGASGAVAGVMGAYFWMFRHARILTFVPPFFPLYLARLDLSGFLGFEPIVLRNGRYDFGQFLWFHSFLGSPWRLWGRHVLASDLSDPGTPVHSIVKHGQSYSNLTLRGGAGMLFPCPLKG